LYSRKKKEEKKKRSQRMQEAVQAIRSRGDKTEQEKRERETEFVCSNQETGGAENRERRARARIVSLGERMGGNVDLWWSEIPILGACIKNSRRQAVRSLAVAASFRRVWEGRLEGAEKKKGGRKRQRKSASTAQVLKYYGLPEYEQQDKAIHIQIKIHPLTLVFMGYFHLCLGR
jgi:hypothetical protein